MNQTHSSSVSRSVAVWNGRYLTCDHFLVMTFGLRMTSDLRLTFDQKMTFDSWPWPFCPSLVWQGAADSTHWTVSVKRGIIGAHYAVKVLHLHHLNATP